MMYQTHRTVAAGALWASAIALLTAGTVDNDIWLRSWAMLLGNAAVAMTVWTFAVTSRHLTSTEIDRHDIHNARDTKKILASCGRDDDDRVQQIR